MVNQMVDTVGFNNASNYKMDTDGYGMGGYQNGLEQEMAHPQFPEHPPRKCVLKSFSN